MGDKLIIAAGAALLGAFLLKKAFPKNKQNIQLISDTIECREALKQIRQHCNDCPILGFDCEWTSTSQYGRLPIALLQLQSYQGLCLLIRLPYVEIIRELQELLTNDQILKVGVDVNRDARYLFDDYSVQCKGLFDLRYMAALAELKPGTLAKMSRDYLRLDLDKGSTLTFNWDTTDLSENAFEFAAKEVEAATCLFKHFEGLIYDGWMYRSSRGRVKYIIDKFCSKFLDYDYNGAQGTPHEFIRHRMLYA